MFGKWRVLAQYIPAWSFDGHLCSQALDKISLPAKCYQMGICNVSMTDGGQHAFGNTRETVHSKEKLVHQSCRQLDCSLLTPWKSNN